MARDSEAATDLRVASNPGTARWLLALAGLNGLMAVGFGAFGAHAVSDPAAKAWLATASQYQLAHAAAIPGVVASLGHRTARWPAALLGGGALIFGGALDVLALGGPRILGAVAPVGGSAMIAGWAGVIVLAWRARARS
jgi:uncharacterized membrane protein YgdD (TMEM256/DUF423 family)